VGAVRKDVLEAWKGGRKVGYDNRGKGIPPVRNQKGAQRRSNGGAGGESARKGEEEVALLTPGSVVRQQGAVEVEVKKATDYHMPFL